MTYIFLLAFFSMGNMWGMSLSDEEHPILLYPAGSTGNQSAQKARFYDPERRDKKKADDDKKDGEVRTTRSSSVDILVSPKRVTPPAQPHAVVSKSENAYKAIKQAMNQRRVVPSNPAASNCTTVVYNENRVGQKVVGFFPTPKSPSSTGSQPSR